MKFRYNKKRVLRLMPATTLSIPFLLLLISTPVQAQLSNSYIQNQVSQYQQANFWINGYARVGGAEGAYNNYLKSYFKTSNAFSGLVLESNGSINVGLTGAYGPNFRFRWLVHNNGAIDYSTTNDVVMQLLNDGTLLVKNKLIVGSVTTSATNYKLNVIGAVRANKVVVNTTGADYVFDSTYQLIPLNKVEQYINDYHHLPGILPAEKIKEDGLELGENQTLLLQKIEELTLYIIELNKKVSRLEEANQDLVEKTTK